MVAESIQIDVRSGVANHREPRLPGEFPFDQRQNLVDEPAQTVVVRAVHAMDRAHEEHAGALRKRQQGWSRFPQMADDGDVGKLHIAQQCRFQVVDGDDGGAECAIPKFRAHRRVEIERSSCQRSLVTSPQRCDRFGIQDD